MAYKRELIIRAIYEAGGNITEAARIVGCAPMTIYRHADKYVTVQNAIDEARRGFKNKLLDYAESELLRAVQEGKAWAIRYALSTQGRVRGYDDRSKVDLDGDITINVSMGQFDLDGGGDDDSD